MINPTHGAFTEVLNHFLMILENVPKNLKDPALYLLFTLLIIDVCMTFIKNVGEVGFSWVKYFVPKVFFVGFLVYLIENWSEIVQQVARAFIAVGCRAIGMTTTPRAMQDPSYIITYGLKSGVKIIQRGGIFVHHGLAVIILGLLFCFCIFMIALQIFLTLVSFYFMCYISIIFIGFGSFHKTSFLLEKVISVLIFFGIRLMMLSLFVALITKQNGIFEVPVSIGVTPLMYHLILMGTLTFIVWKVPEMAASMLTGTPSFSSNPLVAMGVGMGLRGGFSFIKNKLKLPKGGSGSGSQDKKTAVT